MRTSVISPHPHKEFRVVVCIGHLCPGEGETSKYLKFAGQPVYLNQLTLGPVKDLVSENKVERLKKKPLASHAHAYIRTQTYVSHT